jgi:putative addiction module component (TIGR02574 family)
MREVLAHYISEHLDDIEEEMNWSDTPSYLSDELKDELLRREAAAIANPREGSSWDEVKDRILRPKSK